MPRFKALLILVVVALEVLFPNRFFPPSRLLEAAIVVLLSWWLLRDLRGARLTGSGFLVLAGFLAAVGVSYALAMQRHRAVLALSTFLLYAAVYLSVRFGLREAEDGFLLKGVAGIAGLCALWALLQALGGFQEALEFLERVDLPSEDLLRDRLSSGRVFGTFILPSTFASFLILVLPATAWVVGLGVRRGERVAWTALLVLQAWALWRTGSHGAVLALLAALAVTAVFRVPRRLRIRILAGVVLTSLILLSVVHARRDVILNPSDPAGPIRQRLGVWRAAWGMLLDHPLFGVGPGGFGIAFPRYRAAGIHDTNFAHNSYLQILAENGIWTLLPLLLFLRRFAGRFRNLSLLRGAGPEGILLGTGCAAFLVHNLVDFSLLLSATGIPFFLLLGVVDRRGPPDPGGPGRPGSLPRAGVRLLVAAGAVGYLILAGRLYLADHHTAGAIRQYRRGAGEAAVARLERAVEACPGDPAVWGFLASALYRPEEADREELERARSLARRAVELDPFTPFRYDLLGRIAFSLGDDASAYLAFRRAAGLHPGRERYRRSLDAVKERISRVPGTNP